MHCANRTPLAALDAAALLGAEEPQAASPSPPATTATAAVLDLIEIMAEVYRTGDNTAGTASVTPA
jgi:hypothetical protein